MMKILMATAGERNCCRAQLLPSATAGERNCCRAQLLASALSARCGRSTPASRVFALLSIWRAWSPPLQRPPLTTGKNTDKWSCKLDGEMRKGSLEIIVKSREVEGHVSSQSFINHNLIQNCHALYISISVIPASVVLIGREKISELFFVLYICKL